MSNIEITQIREGIPYWTKSKYGVRKKVMIERYWTVSRDGVMLGGIRYALITRERRSPGRRYVNARWNSPGWEWCQDGHHYWGEESTKKRCIEVLTR